MATRLNTQGRRRVTYAFPELSNNGDGLIVVVDLLDRAVELEKGLVEELDVLDDTLEQEGLVFFL